MAVYFLFILCYNISQDEADTERRAIMKDVIATSVFPILLGSCKLSRVTCRKLFRIYGLTSVVLDEERDALSYFSIVSRFKPLPKLRSDEFVLMSLEKIALEHDDMTLLLIPCTNLYSSFVERNREWIEKRFIVRLPENAEAIVPKRA